MTRLNARSGVPSTSVIGLQEYIVSGHALGALPTGLGRPLLGEWTRGGSGGAGGPGSPGEDHRSASWLGLRSGSDAAERKSPLASNQRSVFALRVCPTPTPTVSRPRAFYPSRRSPNAELWVRSFQLLPQSSADGPGFGPELDVLAIFSRSSRVLRMKTLYFESA